MNPKEPRYKTISGRQRDGSDVDVEVCSHCGYADGHDERCLVPEIEQLEERLEGLLANGRCPHDSVNSGNHPTEGFVAVCNKCGNEL